MHVMPTSA